MLNKCKEILSLICGCPIDSVEWQILEFRLSGPPLIKKNGKQIAFNRKTKVSFVRSNDKYLLFSSAQLQELQAQAIMAGYHLPISKNIIVGYKFVLNTKRNSDIDNLLGSPNDLIQAANIISNDFSIVTPFLPIRIWDSKGDEHTIVTLYIPKNIEIFSFCGSEYREFVDKERAKEQRKIDKANKPAKVKVAKNPKYKKEENITEKLKREEEEGINW